MLGNRQSISFPGAGLEQIRKESVLFTGSTAVTRGTGFCYDLDYTTSNTGESATDPFTQRGKAVEIPSTTNNRSFAGVALKDYPAVTGGQYIDIALPGSVVEIAIGVDTTINSTIMTCSASSADAGRFTHQGFRGRGTAIALQTNSSGVLASSYDATGALDSAGTTLTDTGAFSSLVSGTTYDIYIVAGESDGTNVVTPQKTTCTKSSDNAVTLTTSVSDGGTMEVSYYVQEGNQTCLALLDDGPYLDESGLQEVLMPLSGAAAQSMVGGYTYIHGGASLASDSTATLADGTRIGELKAFKLFAAMTANDWLLTVTNGKQQTVDDKIATAGDGTPLNLVSAEFDAANDYLLVQWGGVNWREIDSSGITIASS